MGHAKLMLLIVKQRIIVNKLVSYAYSDKRNVVIPLEVALPALLESGKAFKLCKDDFAEGFDKEFPINKDTFYEFMKGAIYEIHEDESLDEWFQRNYYSNPNKHKHLLDELIRLD